MSYLQKLKKHLSPILLAIFLFVTIFAPIAQAQDTGPWYNQSFDQWQRKVFEDDDEEIFGERYTFAQVQWILYSFAAIITGTDLVECAGLATNDSLDEMKGCVESLGPVSARTGESTQATKRDPGPLVGLAFLTDTVMSTKPISGVEYIAEKATDFNIVPEAQAQGIGFRSLAPVQNIWRAFRNMAYFLLIVVVLVLAFMIMFRVKLNPQTVISVQSALPRVATTLILITFSYAIAGLVVDLSFLVLGLVAAFVKSGGLIADGTSTMDVARALWGSLPVAPLASAVFGITFLLAIVLGVGGGALGGALGIASPLPVLDDLAGLGLGITVGLFILLIAGIFILITLVRILWTLIKAFINILLLTIFAPLVLLLGAVSPGVGGVGVWLRNLASNVAVFAVVSLMAFLSHLLYWSSSHGVFDALGFRSSEVWNPFGIQASFSGQGVALPLVTLSPFLVSFIASLGILLVIPSAAELIKAVLSGQPFAFGTAIGQTFAPLKALGGMAWTASGGRAMQYAAREAAGKGAISRITSDDSYDELIERVGGAQSRFGRMLDDIRNGARN